MYGKPFWRGVVGDCQPIRCSRWAGRSGTVPPVPAVLREEMEQFDDVAVAYRSRLCHGVPNHILVAMCVATSRATNCPVLGSAATNPRPRFKGPGGLPQPAAKAFTFDRRGRAHLQ
jgi:hypothetical protein